MRKIARIKGLSEIRRLPRLGKIRLGVKDTSKKTNREYPKEVDYFVLTDAPGVAEVYGETPKSLDVVIPVEDETVFFPQAYKCYGSERGLKCKGDGEDCLRLDEKRGEFVEGECIPEGCSWFLEGKCRKVGTLFVMLPKVSMAGVYQIDTSSFHSIVDLNSNIDYIRSICKRISMLVHPVTWEPLLVLKRVPRETHGSGRKEIHWTLQLELKLGLDDYKALVRTKLPPAAPIGAIDAPKDEMPEDLYPASNFRQETEARSEPIEPEGDELPDEEQPDLGAPLF